MWMETDGTQRAIRRRGALAGAVAGLLSGLALRLVLVLCDLVQGRDVWLGPGRLGTSLLGAAAVAGHSRVAPVLLGLVVHVGLAVVLGVAFGALAWHLAAWSTMVAGVGCGVVAWLFSARVLLTLVGGLGRPVVIDLPSRMLFGLLLAAAYVPIHRAVERGHVRPAPSSLR